MGYIKNETEVNTPKGPLHKQFSYNQKRKFTLKMVKDSFLARVK